MTNARVAIICQESPDEDGRGDPGHASRGIEMARGLPRATPEYSNGMEA